LPELLRWFAASLLAVAIGAQAGEPLVIAHRGASGYLPEHTLAGYELAIKLGADFIEPDLQLTSDQVLVAIHDDTLQRTTDIAARFAQRNGDYRVADFSLAEIRTLIVKPTGTASTIYPGFQPANPELRVPTFDEVIELAKANSTPERRIGIYPEAKKADPVMEDQLLATLVRHGYGDATDEVFIQSFSDATLRSMDAKQAALGTEIPQILLGAAAALPDGTAVMRVSGGAMLRLADVASFTEGVGVSISNPDFPLTKAFVDQAHAAGLKVHGWTFAQPDPALAADEYRKYFEFGIDGAFSNYADLAVAARKRLVQLPR
jgi:glycerophosphoryl diester phosphodiesterase